MKEKTTISLEILLLNDLLRTKVIDMDLYEKAAKKIATIIPDTTTTTTVPVSA